MSSIYNCIMLAALLCFVLVYYFFSVSQKITIHFLLIQRFFYFIGPKMNFLHPCPLTSFLCSVSPSLLPPLFINIGISIFLKRNSFIIARKRGGGGGGSVHFYQIRYFIILSRFLLLLQKIFQVRSTTMQGSKY